MRVLVLVNAQSGDGRAAGAREMIDGARAALVAAGVEPEVRPAEGHAIGPIAREAIERMDGTLSALVAAGGDGTVNQVAGAVAGTEAAMAVLPMGTLNHFAKDLGLPTDLTGAARAIATGAVREVDVGEVNGRVFVNNSSIGLYPHAVVKRDRQMERLGRGKWLALLVAWVSLFRRFPTVRVRLVTPEGREEECETPFVFVGNNRYQIHGLNLGKRAALDRGELCVYFARRAGRLAMVMLALRALLGRLDQTRDFDSMCVKELWIHTRKRTLRVSVDGEVIRLTPPLHYRVRERALRVVGAAR